MSDFGSGFITCLLQFTFHAPRLYKWGHEVHFEDGIWLWADGAKDHVMELKKPPKVTKADWESACHVRDASYNMAWGSMTYEDRRKFTIADGQALLDEARDLVVKYGGKDLLKGDPGLEGAMSLDRDLGLKDVDPGDAATCTEPIKVK